jgi:hypothetical protein
MKVVFLQYSVHVCKHQPYHFYGTRTDEGLCSRARQLKN